MKKLPLIFLMLILPAVKKLPAQTIHFLNEGWTFAESGKNQLWRPAYVPGNVHRDLQMNNVIPDPVLGNNYKLWQWAESRDWEYKCTFSYPDLLDFQNTELVFEGLDTYADIYLNDSLILKAENMFREYIVPVKKFLKEQNMLRILFHNPVRYVQDKVKAAGIKYPADNDASSPFTRKAALHYGWDFSQRFVTCGIWRKIYLRGWNDFIIRDLHVLQISVNENLALMKAEVEIESAGDDTLQLDLVTDGVMDKKPVKKGVTVFSIQYAVTHPVLWWPNGMGNQKLYALHVQVQNKKRFSWKEIKYGIRTIEIINENDSAGKNFYLKVNGMPLFAKGCNYVPSLNVYRNDTPADRYTSLFSAVKNCNMNMVRVWGGGIYEADEFYSLADQYGILVWQDFMFSGTLYPGDTAFLKNVAKEAEYNIRRLRSHPSLALWCGNNEIEVAWKNWGWQRKYNYSKEDSIRLWNDYQKLFNDLLPRKVKELDDRFYFSSSPQSSWGKKEDFNYGDNHYWGIWHGEEPFESYLTHVPRFASEFGFQSFPQVSSIKKFSAVSDLAISSPVMKAHQFSYKGNGLMQKYTNLYYRLPKDFSSRVYLSQLLQAEGLKLAIETYRTKKPFCMGALYWQLNDSWPAASWSSIDYYGEWKAAQYFARNAFAPVMASVSLEKNKLHARCINDPGKSFDGKITFQLIRFDGMIIQQEEKVLHFSGAQIISLWDDSLNVLLKGNDKRKCLLSVKILHGDSICASAVFYFAPVKELVLPRPVISTELSKENNKVKLKLKTNVLAKNVFVYLDGAVMISELSDNYFDLLPGEEKILYFYSDKTVEELKKALELKTVRDTY